MFNQRKKKHYVPCNFQNQKWRIFALVGDLLQSTVVPLTQISCIRQFFLKSQNPCNAGTLCIGFGSVVVKQQKFSCFPSIDPKVIVTIICPRADLTSNK